MFLLVVVGALLLAGCGGPPPEPPEPRRVTLLGLVVESVPADTGFWGTTTRDERVWVKLVLPGRSSMPVQPGERVDVTGVVVPHGPGFAARAGVTSARDVELLSRQGSHLRVEQADVRVVGAGQSGA
jgi:hypothetical protein